MYSYEYQRIVNPRYSLETSRVPVFFPDDAIMKDDSTVQNRSITRERVKERDSEETRAKVREKGREEKKREREREEEM